MKDLTRVLTNLENVVAVGIKRSLSQFDDEDTVGATGLSVQTGVGHLPLFLTWGKNNKRQPFLFSCFFSHDKPLNVIETEHVFSSFGKRPAQRED